MSEREKAILTVAWLRQSDNLNFIPTNWHTTDGTLAEWAMSQPYSVMHLIPYTPPDFFPIETVENALMEYPGLWSGHIDLKRISQTVLDVCIEETDRYMNAPQWITACIAYREERDRRIREEQEFVVKVIHRL